MLSLPETILPKGRYLGSRKSHYLNAWVTFTGVITVEFAIFISELLTLSVFPFKAAMSACSFPSAALENRKMTQGKFPVHSRASINSTKFQAGANQLTKLFMFFFPSSAHAWYLEAAASVSTSRISLVHADPESAKEPEFTDTGNQRVIQHSGEKRNKEFHKFLQRRDVWFLALSSLWKWAAASKCRRGLLVTEGEETIGYSRQRPRPWMVSLTPRHLEKRANIALIVLSLTVNDEMTSFTKLMCISQLQPLQSEIL